MKEYLNQVRKADNKIKSLINEVDNLNSQKYSLASPSFKEKIGSNPDNKAAFEKVIWKCDEKVAKLAAAQIEAIDLRSKIYHEIYSIDNAIYTDILYKRYFEYKRWEQIAVDTNYSIDNVHKLHGKALFKLQEYINC